MNSTTIESESNTPYITDPAKPVSTRPVPKPLDLTLSDITNEEEDSRQDVRVRFHAEEENREFVQRPLPSPYNSCERELLEKGVIRESSPRPIMPSPKCPDDGSEKGSPCLTRCAAFSQDSLDRRRSSETQANPKRFRRSDSFLLRHRNREDNPATKWVYWEETVDPSSKFTFEQS